MSFCFFLQFAILLVEHEVWRCGCPIASFGMSDSRFANVPFCRFREKPELFALEQLLYHLLVALQHAHLLCVTLHVARVHVAAHVHLMCQLRDVCTQLRPLDSKRRRLHILSWLAPDRRLMAWVCCRIHAVLHMDVLYGLFGAPLCCRMCVTSR